MKAREQVVCIAPEPELIRYLSIFRRAFTVLAAYGKSKYRPGMKFVGMLANALHNVPQALLHYDDPFVQGPLPLDQWLGYAFPARVASMGPPEHVLDASRMIFSREGTLIELGLRTDKRNLCLAPTEAMKHYLNMLYESCLGIRIDLGSLGENVPKDDDAPSWAFFSLMGQCMRDVPCLLVRWSDANESEFWANALQASSTCPDEAQTRWRQYVRNTRPSWVELRPSRKQKSTYPSPVVADAGQAHDTHSLSRFRPYQWVTDRIAIGSAVAEEDIVQLVRDGITHVLDCRLGPGSIPLYEGTRVVYRQLGVADDGKPKPDDWFWAGIDFVIAALRLPHARVLVHCKFGMSRSPSMAYAILLAQGMPDHEAKESISRARIVARVTYEKDAHRAARRWLRRLNAGRQPP